MIEKEVKRGQIYMAILDPVFGREMGGFKPRPVLVLSINDLQRNTRMVTTVPGTSTRANFPNIVEVRPSSNNRLSEATFFQCHQVRSIDQARLMPWPGGGFGMLSKGDLEKIENAVMYSLGLFPHQDIERLRKKLLE